LLVEKFLFGRHAAAGIDGADAFGHDPDLGAAHGFGERVKLAVDVAGADLVQIHQRQGTQAGAGERFRRPGADTADADHADVGRAQLLQPVVAVKPRDTAEPGLEIAHASVEFNRKIREIHENNRVVWTQNYSGPALNRGVIMSYV
jgi:hypothetical protein